MKGVGSSDPTPRPDRLPAPAPLQPTLPLASASTTSGASLSTPLPARSAAARPPAPTSTSSGASLSTPLPARSDWQALTRPAPPPGLPADVVSAWMKRTAGLSAPRAPREGDLVPNGTGWVLGLGSIRRRMFPRAALAVDRSGLLAPISPAISYYLGFGNDLLPFLGVMAAVVAIPFAVLELCARIAGRRERARARPIDRPDAVDPGTHVTFRATVCEQPTVPALARGAGSVLYRNRLLGTDETRGIDFWVELPGGQHVKVSARDAILLDHPAPTPDPPACGPVWLGAAPRGERVFTRLQPAPPTGPSLWHRLLRPRLRESALLPGTSIQLWGILDREPAPDGERGPGRTTPLRTVLRARNDVRLYVQS
jgi:hypothetical protein